MSNINKIRLSGTTYDIEDLNAAKTVELTQAQYDALAVKDPNTFYIITDAEPVDMSDYYTKDEVDDELDGKADTATTYTKTEVDTALGAKQATLVSGTNIKTVNNESLLGEGNIEIQGGGATYSAGTNISIDTANTINCTLPISAGTVANSIITNANNQATKKGSAAIGYGTKATYSYAFAQGAYSEAKQYACHAEGEYSIAEGYVSHAEGYRTNAKGGYTHTEGYYTKALNDYEHASGNYNNSVNGSTDADKTLFSVGNGTADNARHNAFEIRQNGDIYISKDGVDVKLQDQLGGGSVTVDTELDSTSENPVQNKVIYQKFDEVEEVTAAALNALNDKIGDINTLLEGI